MEGGPFFAGATFAGRNRKSYSMRFTSSGYLDYSIREGLYRLVVLVDEELHRFYRSLIPPQYVCRRPKYPPHITVVRRETPLTDSWGLSHGMEVSFEYDSFIHRGHSYWWLNCYSEELNRLRVELGLPHSCSLTRPPDGTECFHSTLGNEKT